METCGNMWKHVSVPWAKAEDIFAPSYTRHGHVRVALALFLAKAVAWRESIRARCGMMLDMMQDCTHRR